jgi:hypothetical protein
VLNAGGVAHGSSLLPGPMQDVVSGSFPVLHSDL